MRQGKTKSEAGESGPQGCLSLLPSTGSLALSLPPDRTKEMLRFPAVSQPAPLLLAHRLPGALSHHATGFLEPDVWVAT